MQRTIAVGVGGASGLRALAWATDEVAGPQTRLVLLRVCPSCSPLARLTGEPPVLMLERADHRLAQAVAATGSLRDVQRRLRVVVGEPGTALAEASAGADLLVIGATSGAVAGQLVRNTHCPLVVVRPVAAGRGDPFAGHVVVGVDGSDAGRGALEFVFAYAAAHRLPVAAAHVSDQSDADHFPGDAPPSTGSPAQSGALELLNAEVEPWELKYPHVQVRRAILRGAPADRLVRAGAGAALIVIGSERGEASGNTGRLPQAVTERAPCPVTAWATRTPLRGEFTGCPELTAQSCLGCLGRVPRRGAACLRASRHRGRPLKRIPDRDGRSGIAISAADGRLGCGTRSRPRSRPDDHARSSINVGAGGP